MRKVNLYIKYSLVNEKNEYNIKGILQNKIIKYYDNDIKMIVDLNNNILERIKNEDEYLFDFNISKCYIKTKDVNISLPIKIIECNIENNNYYVKYQINGNLCEYKIKVLEEI